MSASARYSRDVGVGLGHTVSGVPDLPIAFRSPGESEVDVPLSALQYEGGTASLGANKFSPEAALIATADGAPLVRESGGRVVVAIESMFCVAATATSRHRTEPSLSSVQFSPSGTSAL